MINPNKCYGDGATGRNMPAEIVIVADLVIECAMVKHPFQQGIDARRGIEY